MSFYVSVLYRAGCWNIAINQDQSLPYCFYDASKMLFEICVYFAKIGLKKSPVTDTSLMPLENLETILGVEELDDSNDIIKSH